MANHGRSAHSITSGMPMMRKRSASSAGLDLEQHLSCPVCLEIYDNPKSLKCRHTICARCLDMMMATAPIMHHISCPVCRRFSTCYDIKEDFQMQSLVSVYSAERPSPTHPCDLCEVKSFEVYCTECQKTLCVSCIDFHSKIPGCAHHTFSWKPYLEKKSKKLRREIDQVQKFGKAMPTEIYNHVIKVYNDNSAAIMKASHEALQAVKNHYGQMRSELEKNCTSFLRDQYQMQSNLVANVGDLSKQVEQVVQRVNQREDISVNEVKLEMQELEHISSEASQTKQAFHNLYQTVPNLVNITKPDLQGPYQKQK